jgi:hypothetical protein
MIEVVNIFGEHVEAPKLPVGPSTPAPEPEPKQRYAKIPLAEMSPEEKREYFRTRAAASRKKKREEEEAIEEQRRLKQAEDAKDTWGDKAIVEAINSEEAPEDWEGEINEAYQPILKSMILELDRPGPWLFKDDAFIVMGLATVALGIQKGFVQCSPLAGCRVGGIFPDAQMETVITYGRLDILKKSQSFLDLYALGFRGCISLMNDAKYAPFMQWTSEIVEAYHQLVNDKFSEAGLPNSPEPAAPARDGRENRLGKVARMDHNFMYFRSR